MVKGDCAGCASASSSKMDSGGSVGGGVEADRVLAGAAVHFGDDCRYPAAGDGVVVFHDVVLVVGQWVGAAARFDLVGLVSVAGRHDDCVLVVEAADRCD